MKQHVAIVIAALMIASMAFAISTTVSATHERTASIDDDSVQDNTPMVRVITIANDGPDAIENVRIILPADFTGLAPMIMIFEDNEVTLGDNLVTLQAGTLVQLGACTLVAVENTHVIIPSGTKIRWKPAGDNVDGLLSENLDAKLMGDNFPISDFAENVKGTGDIVTTLNSDYSTARLLEDTQVVLGDENKVRLPKDTKVQLVKGTTANIGPENQVTLENDKSVGLGDNSLENTISPPGDNTGRTFVALAEVTTNTIYMVSVGDNVLIWDTSPKDIIFPAGTELVLDSDSVATLFENTEVTRAANENVTMEAATAEAAENQPKNWTQTVSPSVLPSGNYVEWVGDENNQIASGEPLDFPFALKTPTEGGDYTIYVRTTDTEGVVVQSELTLTVDNVSPTIEIAASPEWAKANTKVTITVTADEPLAKLENVMVAENCATENTQVTMTPNADKTFWTGTYTTENEDYENLDGTAMIYVFGFEDLVGNDGGENTATFNVDRMAPPTPVLDDIIGFPITPTTNDATWFIEGNAKDNYLDDVANTVGMTVNIRVGATTYDVTSGENGYFSKSITLTEGIQEVGIWYVDKAGNAGEENAENVTLDTMVPSIEWGKIAGKALVDGVRINDNAPTITLTISDAGLGVDNWDFNAGDNTGYSVQLRYENNTPIENLVNALAHDNHVLAFENTISELTDNTYCIYVVAGDNLQPENKLVKFVIDTAAPSAPTVGDAYKIVSSMDSPVVVKDASRTIAGTAEAGADITVYGTVDTTEKVLGTATAGSDEKWTVTFTLTAGSNTKIEVSATDEAGNEGSRELYGWMLADASAPTVTLDELSDTTDKTSVTISGTVSKDAWEDWSEITLTVQVGTGKVEVPCVGGSYEYSLSLAEGPNTIVVQATDDIGNVSPAATDVVERTITPWATYAIVLVIIALVMAAIAIFRKR